MDINEFKKECAALAKEDKNRPRKVIARHTSCGRDLLDSEIESMFCTYCAKNLCSVPECTQCSPESRIETIMVVT